MQVKKLGGVILNELKLKQTEKQLSEKLQQITKFIPRLFQQDFKQSAFISGGCIYSLYNDQEPKDYDVFLTDTELAKSLHEYFSNVIDLTDHGVIKKGTYKGETIIVSVNAISIGEFQIITRWSGSIESVLEEFDFLHNQFYFKDGKVDTITEWDYLEDTKLRYNEKRARDICGTICRIPKFAKRGFEVSQREVAKMLLKLNEVGFNDREVEILHNNNRDFES